MTFSYLYNLYDYTECSIFFRLLRVTCEHLGYLPSMNLIYTTFWKYRCENETIVDVKKKKKDEKKDAQKNLTNNASIKGWKDAGADPSRLGHFMY